MAITDIANVVISLQTSGVTRAGFGTPLFLSKHRHTGNVVDSYTSLSSVAADFPTDSNVYKAAQAVFGNSPAPKVFKVGRIEADLKLTVDSVANGKVFSFSIGAGTNAANITVTATGSDTVTTIATAIAAAIEASSVAAQVVATSAIGVVTVVKGTADFFVQDVSNLTISYASTATAPATMAAVTESDDDFYFVTAEDHSEAWVLALAADVEARKKLYFVSVSGAANYATKTLPAGAGDILGKLQDAGYFRTAGLYSHTADTAFPELAWVGYNSPFDAGSVTWTNLRVAIPYGLNATGGILTGTQQNNIAAKNATFVRREGGLNATRGGLVAGGEQIENIRGRDDLESTMKANITNLLLNQQGSKLPYTNVGLNQIRSVMNKSLDVFVARNFINPDYIVTLPDARDVLASKKAQGLFDEGSFVAVLSGAITLIDIRGTLALEF